MAAPLKLYWCTTTDHDEDWFIVSRSAPQARKWHATEEGCDSDMVTAEAVARLPEPLQRRGDSLLGWPEEEVIEACGGVFVARETPRVVKLGERVFSEGMLQAQILEVSDDVFEAAGEGRPNRTRRTQKV